jgi:hypothetical protein
MEKKTSYLAYFYAPGDGIPAGLYEERWLLLVFVGFTSNTFQVGLRSHLLMNHFAFWNGKQM